MFLIASLHCFHLLLFGFLYHCCFYYFHGTHLYLHRSATLLDYHTESAPLLDEDEDALKQ